MPCSECMMLAPSTCVDHPSPKAIPVKNIAVGDHVIALVDGKRRRFRVALKRVDLLIVRDSTTNKRYGFAARPDNHVDFVHVNDANEVLRVQAGRVPLVQVLKEFK